MPFFTSGSKRSRSDLLAPATGSNSTVSTVKNAKILGVLPAPSMKILVLALFVVTPSWLLSISFFITMTTNV